MIIGLGLSISRGGAAPSFRAQVAAALGATPAFFLDADSGALASGGGAAVDGGKVATWTQQGNGTASNATQATDANRPIFRATMWPGNRKCLDFVSTSPCFMTGTFSGTASGDSWFFWVACLPDFLNNRAPFDSSDTTATNRGVALFYTSTPLANGRWGNSAGANTSTGTPAAAGNARILSYGGNTDARTIYENNTALSGGTNPEGTDRAISALANYTIGTLMGGSLFPYEGLIRTIVGIKGVPTSGQRSAMQTLLAAHCL